MTDAQPAQPPIVDARTWRRSLAQLRMKEKAMTRAIDELNAARRRLPMYRVDDSYRFSGEDGDTDLPGLFEGHSQLIVYHFMFAPDASAGCPGCSWVVDAMSHAAHLRARDVRLVLVSRAPLEQLLAYRERMAWDLPWYSSFGSGFNADFDATTQEGEEHGVSVFLQRDAEVYRTYHTGDRGVEHLGSHWTYLDLTPFGRQESWEDSPAGWPQAEPYTWDQRHDEYDDPG